MTGFMQEGFLGLRDKIDQLASFSKLQLSSMHHSAPEVGRKQLLEWIDAVHTDDAYDQAKSARLSGTCDWILRRPEFQIWTNLDPAFDFSKVFWIYGPPGFGKTVLSARLLEFLFMQKAVPVAHFFCIGGDDVKRQPRAIIRSWLAQLLNQNPVAVEVVRDFYYGKEARRATDSDVWTLFREVTRKIGTCFFAIDGYDECIKPDLAAKNSANDRSVFLRELLAVAKDLKVRLLLVSRPEPDIRIQLSFCSRDWDSDAFLEYEITRDDTEADIHSFSKKVVEQELPNKPEDFQREIASEAAKKSEGMFLWIKLVHAKLSPGLNAKQLREAVKVTPTGLDQAFERDLRKIEDLEAEEKERAIAILRWLLFAERPLTVRELSEALLIHDHDAFNHFPVDDLPDAWDDYYANDQIRRLCGSLVELRRSNPHEPIMAHTVHLVHFSVKEYLLRDGGISLSNSRGQRVNYSNPSLEHCHLAQKCLLYLCYEDFRKRCFTEADVESKIDQYAFLRYVAQSWYHHASLVTVQPMELLKLMYSLFEPVASRWLLWSKVLERETGRSESPHSNSHRGPQYYAAKLGLTQVLDFLRYNGVDLNSKLSGPTLLQVAAENVEVSAVDYLLKHGADVHANEGEFRSAIVAAAASPHFNEAEAVISLLIKRGAHVESEDSNGMRPLHFAARNGAIGVIKILLGARAYVDGKSGYGQTPLHTASVEGQKEAVDILLKHGANVKKVDEAGWTALHNAAHNGHESIVEMLLQNGALVDAPTESGWTALDMAASEGHVNVIELLLRNGANIPSKSSKGGSALHFAAYKGHESAVRSLIGHGADAALRDEVGATALHSAVLSVQSTSKIVEMLIAHGIAVDAVNQNGGTAIHLAVKQKYKEIVATLLKHNANCDIAAVDGWNPLLSAVGTGDEDMVKLLLDADANVNVESEGGWTPLLFAADRGYEKILALLLKAGADLHQKTALNQTPLHKAVYRGSKPIIKMLLEHGADPLEKDVFGHTCMDWASSDPVLFGLMQPYCKDYSHEPTDPAVQLEHLRQSIKSAIDVLKETTHDTLRIHWINHIGRCLLQMNEVNDASIIFAGAMILSPKDSQLSHFAICDTCADESYIIGDRYICHTCAQVDACSSCMKKHQETPFLPTCKGHKFLKIPRDDWQMPADGTQQGEIDDFLLAELMTKYRLHDDMN